MGIDGWHPGVVLVKGDDIKNGSLVGAAYEIMRIGEGVLAARPLAGGAVVETTIRDVISLGYIGVI